MHADAFLALEGYYKSICKAFPAYGLLVFGCLACRREVSGSVAYNVFLLVGLIVGDAFKLSGVGFESLGTVWADVSFSRGIKAMREAALDGTDYVIVRMRYNTIANRNCYLYHDGVMYMITEFKRSYADNIIQIKAQETTDKRVIVTPATDTTGTVANDNENNQGV